MWFDHKKIQPVGFRFLPAETGFEISFQSEVDATTFDAGFGWHVPPA